jgi:SAM-dependent methyltransferase
MTAPDGSPVALYRRLPPRTADAGFVDRLLGPARAPGTILDLGCGTGRLAEPLAAMGHTVVAVDNEPEMLSHLTLSRPVRAEITSLRLEREAFDAVLLMSHLVNNPDTATVKAMLETAQYHLRPNGFCVIERYPPGWVATCAERTTERDGVRFTLRDLSRDAGGVLTATMVYEFDGGRFEQRFQAREFDETLLAGFGGACHLLP